MKDTRLFFIEISARPALKNHKKDPEYSTKAEIDYKLHAYRKGGRPDQKRGNHQPSFTIISTEEIFEGFTTRTG